MGEVSAGAVVCAATRGAYLRCSHGADLGKHGPRVLRVPTSRPTPTRSVRISDDLWQAAQRIAAEQGEYVTDVIVRALDLYSRSHGWQVDPVTALERLARLHERGALTDQEFRTAKVDLLARL